MRVLRLSPTAVIPARGSRFAAGYDLAASERATIPAARAVEGRVSIGRALVPTGIAIELPPSSVGRIGSRSGLSVKKNIEVGAGWIDPDYRGEILVELKNLSADDVVFEPGDRIAQLFILPTRHPKIVEAKSLSRTARQAGGFGSTGVKAARGKAPRPVRTRTRATQR